MHVSATFDLTKSKPTSGMKPPGEIFKIICLISDNYIHSLRYRHLLFVTHMTAKTENILPNCIRLYFPGNLIILDFTNFHKKYTGT